MLGSLPSLVVQVKQAIAREAAKGHMKWEQAVLDALKLSRDDVTSLSEEEAQVPRLPARCSSHRRGLHIKIGAVEHARELLLC